jgi:peptide-methionine (S)-S-oxide reductase
MSEIRKRNQPVQRLALSLPVACLLLGMTFTPSAGGAENKADPISKDIGTPDTLAVATFAGGCFWCMEPPFDALPGVMSTTSGYAGGHKRNPTYEEVSAGGTGHLEAVQVVYDPALISYRRLLDVFWRNVDPTDASGQFCDKGEQYRTAIFYHNDEQKRLAEASRKELGQNKSFPEPVVTEIAKFTVFYPAEDEHQDYYLKNPGRYKLYRYLCGRDQRLEQLWGSGR